MFPIQNWVFFPSNMTMFWMGNVTAQNLVFQYWVLHRSLGAQNNKEYVMQVVMGQQGSGQVLGKQLLRELTLRFEEKYDVKLIVNI